MVGGAQPVRKIADQNFPISLIATCLVVLDPVMTFFASDIGWCVVKAMVLNSSNMQEGEGIREDLVHQADLFPVALFECSPRL